jgi:hypothetical protein
MPILALKLVLTPALIAAASLAGRRWGPAVSGWFVGLPFTSGPIIFFLALAHGIPFAAAAAAGTLAGTLSEAVFCLAYAWVAFGLGARRSGWPLAFAASVLAFIGATTVLMRFPLALVPLVPAAFVALPLAMLLMPRNRQGRASYGATDDSGALSLSKASAAPRPGANARPLTPPRWDLPLRMAVASGFVVLLTALAPFLGAQLTGLLAPFPLFASVLTVFAHQQQGAAAAVGVLRGLLYGLFAFACFFVVLALLLAPAGIALAFAVALAAALLVQVGTLSRLRANA